MNDCFINTGGITPMKLNLNAPFFQFINTAFDYIKHLLYFDLPAGFHHWGGTYRPLYSDHGRGRGQRTSLYKNLFSYLYPVFYPVQSSVCRLHLHRCPASFLPVFLAFLWKPAGTDPQCPFPGSADRPCDLPDLPVSSSGPVWMFLQAAFIQCPVYRHLPSACYRTVCRNLCGSRISL